MYEDRHVCFPSPEAWKRVFSVEPPHERKLELWEDALVGDGEWARFLGSMVGKETISIKRVKQLVDQHSRNGKFIGGRVFSPMCGVVLFADFLSDRRRSRPVPICFNKERLGAEWRLYNSIAKRRIRSGAANVRHHHNELILPGAPLESEVFQQMGDCGQKLRFEICALDHLRRRNEIPPGYWVQSIRFSTFSEAIDRCVASLTRSIYPDLHEQLPVEALKQLDEFALRNSEANGFYVTMADKSLLIERV